MSNQALRRFVSNVGQMIASGDTDRAFDQLGSFLASGAPELYNEVVVQTARYQRLRRNERKGLLTNEQFEVEQNKLNKALMALLEELPTRVESKMSPLSTEMEMT